jgi:hypothetical protein
MATGKLVVDLDLNVYSRPFDDQTQEKIRRETEAINVIWKPAVAPAAPKALGRPGNLLSH